MIALGETLYEMIFLDFYSERWGPDAFDARNYTLITLDYLAHWLSINAQSWINHLRAWIVSEYMISCREHSANRKSLPRLA
jgi:hypothetical protein